MEKKMVKTWLTAEEKEILTDKAKACGLSEAEYLRRLIANDPCTAEEKDVEDSEEGEKTLYRIHISNKAYDILMDNVSQSKISRDAFLDKLITDGKVDVIPYDRINQNVFALCDALDSVNRKVESAMIIARRENKDMSDVIDTIATELEELNDLIRNVVRDNKNDLQKIRRVLRKERK